jgi:hypothetical protein
MANSFWVVKLAFAIVKKGEVPRTITNINRSRTHRFTQIMMARKHNLKLVRERDKNIDPIHLFGIN